LPLSEVIYVLPPHSQWVCLAGCCSLEMVC